MKDDFFKDQLNLIKNSSDENSEKLIKFTLGLNKFLTSNYKRSSNRKIIWGEGSTSLIDCSSTKKDKTILFIPSLINKSYILDLKENYSLAEYISHYANCYIVDFGEPIGDEYQFSINDYIIRIRKIIDFIFRLHDRKVTLVGYCLGGIFSIVLSQLDSEKIEKIAIMACPWDISKVNLPIEYLFQDDKLTHFVPHNIIRLSFYLNDINRIMEKYIEFSTQDDNELFIAVEKWVNDGISLSGKVAAECLFNYKLHQAGNIAKWVIGDQTIDPTLINNEVLILIPIKDRLCQLEAMKTITNFLNNYKVETIDSGHVGMLIGSKAKDNLWQILSQWI